MKSLSVSTFLSLLITLAAITAAADEKNDVTASSTKASVGTITVNPIIGSTLMDLKGLEQNQNVPSGDTSMKSGMTLGVMGSYQLEYKDSSIEAGLMYMETGTSVDAFFVSVDTTLSYLALPVNWKLPIGQLFGAAGHFKAGVMPAFLMGAEVTGGGLLSGMLEDDIKDAVNSFDFLAQAGLGASYQLQPNMQLQLDAAFIRGFTKVLKEGGGYNQGLSLSLALAISI